MKTKTFWLLLLYPIVGYGLDQVVRVLRLSMARDFTIFPNLVILAFTSLVFMGISLVVCVHLTRKKAESGFLLFFFILGLLAWFYPLLPPQFSFGLVSYGFNSYVSLSGALMLLLSGWKFFLRFSGRENKN